MTIKQFGKKFNLSESDMLEIFICMNAFSIKIDDWNKKYYESRIVSDIDNISDPKKLEEKVENYKQDLKRIFYSKLTKNSNANEIIQKAELNRNEVLRNFAKS